MTTEGGTVFSIVVYTSRRFWFYTSWLAEALLREVCLFSPYLRRFKILKATLFTNPALHAPPT